MLIPEIARELGVEAILEGSVFGSGDSVRIQLQLIGAFPEEPGERLYLDTSGPYACALSGPKYWAKVCDQYSKKTWGAFMKKKSEVPAVFRRLVTKLKNQGYNIKYLRCDNAGEHQRQLIDVCIDFGIQLEYTSPHTPQQNGVVERKFVTDRERAHAMMLGAQFTPVLEKCCCGQKL